ncbi:MAG TPA: TIGR01777 family oxidoreductase [bacterium]
MHVLVSGSSGLIGSALRRSLLQDGHRVTRLVRAAPRPGDDAVLWDPSGAADPAGLSGADAVVHLAGEHIASGRWTAAKRARIRHSRVDGTRVLAETLARADARPGALICASAVGFYGDRGEEVLREDSPPGSGFLPEVCRAWEAAAAPAAKAGIRVVHLRFGMVLSPSGGALAMMLPVFRLGLGGRLGGGRQYQSWISIDDAVGVIRHAMTEPRLTGPVNAVAPGAPTNAEFTRALGRALKRPAGFPVPAFAVRLLFGGMADEVLLASARAEPAKLLGTGYRFHHPEPAGALEALLRGPTG